MSTPRTPKPESHPAVRLAVESVRARSAAWDELWRRLLAIAAEPIEAEDEGEAR